MGCCCSGHEEAAETDLPPPLLGKDIRVKLKRQGWFGMDADFDILDCTQEGGEEKPVKWLLLDAVGDMGCASYDFYLKYRPKGVEESYVLGCADMQKDHDYMWYEITYAHQHYGRKPRTGSRRNRKWTDKQVSGRYIVARRARLFSDKDKQYLCGRLQIMGTGTYSRHYHHETWRQKVRYQTKHGDRTVTRTRWEHRSSTSDTSDAKMDHFWYKMDAYGTEYNIQYHEKASGSWLESSSLTFQATHQETGVPLFKVVSDGTKNASVETFSQSDPVSTLLAAFAISIKLEPKEFHGVIGDYCKKNMSLNTFAGEVGGFGLNDEQYLAAWPLPEAAVAVPAMGYSYGVQLDTLPMAAPVVTGTPMTYVAPVATPVAWSVPAFEPIPMAVPIALPVIAEGVVLPAEDGANDASWAADGDDEADPDGGDDDGGADDDGQDEAYEATPVPMATPIAVQYADPVPLPMATVVAC